MDDVDGVILLRPTVSPIIYKQQIGRALAAGKKKNAVILDIILNIENLYSTDSIKEEMQVVTTYYRSLGMVWDIPNDLWEENYIAAVRYHRAHGHAQIPWNYVDNGVWLNKWLSERTTRLNERPTGKNKIAKN